MRAPALAALLAFLLVGAPVGAQSLTGKVVAVHDGDTISIRTSSSTIRVRLVGIDCPEARQPFSARAKRFTSQMVFGKTVTVRGEGLDRYDRLLGRVLVDGVDVNEALVRHGLAWHYGDGAGDRHLAEAEKAARAARVGLWSDPDPIPPWRWRRVVPSAPRPRSKTGSKTGVGPSKTGVGPASPSGSGLPYAVSSMTFVTFAPEPGSVNRQDSTFGRSQRPSLNGKAAVRRCSFCQLQARPRW